MFIKGFFQDKLTTPVHDSPQFFGVQLQIVSSKLTRVFAFPLARQTKRMGMKFPWNGGSF